MAIQAWMEFSSMVSRSSWMLGVVMTSRRSSVKVMRFRFRALLWIQWNWVSRCGSMKPWCLDRERRVADVVVVKGGRLVIVSTRQAWGFGGVAQIS